MAHFGPVSGDVTGDTQFKGNVSFAQGAAGAAFNFIKKDTQIWYVDSGKSPSVTGDGTTWEEAFLTLQEAVTAAGDFDTILIAPNSIEAVAAAGIDITQEGLKIYGSASTEATQVAALKCTGTAAMIRIGANRVEIAGLYFSQRGAYTCIEIGTAAVGAVYETHIHHCNFDGYGTATYGVRGYGGTVDTVCLVVEDCYFMSFATACISSNGTRDSYRRNTFQVATDTIGITIEKHTAHRHWGVYVDNLFFGKSNSSTKGIYQATKVSSGSACIARNLFSGTWDETITATDQDIGVQNFYSHTTGGTVVDCNSSA